MHRAMGDGVRGRFFQYPGKRRGACARLRHRAGSGGQGTHRRAAARGLRAWPKSPGKSQNGNEASKRALWGATDITERTSRARKGAKGRMQGEEGMGCLRQGVPKGGRLSSTRRCAASVIDSFRQGVDQEKPDGARVSNEGPRGAPGQTSGGGNRAAGGVPHSSS